MKPFQQMLPGLLLMCLAVFWMAGYGLGCGVLVLELRMRENKQTWRAGVAVGWVLL